MEYSLIQLVSLIPHLYVISAAILVSWGVVNSAALFLAIKNIKRCNYPVRSNDILHLNINIMLLSLNVVLLNVVPIFYISFSDMLLIMNFWIAIYYCFVGLTCMKDWYLLISSEHIRPHPRDNGDCLVVK